MNPSTLVVEQAEQSKRWYPLTTMASSQENNCICNLRDHIDFDKHHFDHTQQKEEVIMAHYSKVLDALQKQYLDIRTRISTEIQGSFEEDVLEGVLDHLRDLMGNNEYCVAEARRKLWVTFNAEEGIEVRSKE